MIPVAAAMAGVQGILGIAQTIKGSIDAKKAARQLKPFETPDEVVKILHATQSQAQSGFDPFTLSYMTNQVDRAASEATGAAARLGADPNDLSSLLDQRIQGIMKIGAENANLNMANVSRYLGALDVVGQNDEAEQLSKQNLIKDKLQAAQANKSAGMANIGSAMNAGISIASASKIAKIGADANPNSTGVAGVGSVGGVANATYTPNITGTLRKYGGFQPLQSNNLVNPINIKTSDYLNVRQAVQGILPNNPAIRYR